jgi:hypothetical protein
MSNNFNDCLFLGALFNFANLNFMDIFLLIPYTGLLNNIVAQRGIYDYLVVCDTTNNTPTTIDRNELHIDIAIEPTKAVEFIYIPVRILNTGAIAGTGANQGGLSNTTSSVALGTVTATG